MIQTEAKCLAYFHTFLFSFCKIWNRINIQSNTHSHRQTTLHTSSARHDHTQHWPLCSWCSLMFAWRLFINSIISNKKTSIAAFYFISIFHFINGILRFMPQWKHSASAVTRTALLGYPIAVASFYICIYVCIYIIYKCVTIKVFQIVIIVFFPLFCYYLICFPVVRRK